LLLTGCPRKDAPPKLSIICILDGHGGADCADVDGKPIYKAPSELAGFWATTQEDQKNFASWCFKVPVAKTERAMAHLEAKIMSKRDLVPREIVATE
jgi:hypothetical protein